MKITLRNYINNKDSEEFDFYMLELTDSLVDILNNRGVHVKATENMIPPIYKESFGCIWVWGERDFAEAKEICDEVLLVLQKHNPAA